MTERRKAAITAFGFPVLLALVLMAFMGQYPFGDRSLLIWDMNWQYSAFFAHLSDILHGDASALYSFSRAIGGDMVGVFAYYLLSPFNLLLIFFDASNIYAGIVLILLLKIGAAGLTMHGYLRRKHPGAGMLLFSTAYALSGYMAGYFFNIMWLDGIVLLPLMVLGIEQLVEEKRCLLYIGMIALGVVTNFYIGYMLCIFSVLYFGCYFLLMTEQEKKIGTVVRYAASSLLGGALSACVALPTVLAMRGGKSMIDLKVLRDFTRQFDWRTLASCGFLGATSDMQITQGYPLLYCGVLVLLLGLAYFGLKGISWKRKLSYFLLLALLIVSTNLRNLCSAWQAFNLPNGSPYRFTFLYIFVLILVAAEAYAKLAESEREWDKRALLVTGALLLLVLAYTCRKGFMPIQRGAVLAANVLLLVAYPALLLLVKSKTIRSAALTALLGMELCVNAGCLYHYSPQYENERVTDYRDYVAQIDALTEEIKNEDGLFRTVLAGDAYRTVNDAMLFNLYGLDSYTSVERNSTQDTAFQLGYYTNMIFGIHYKGGGTQAAESLLGVKYLVTSDPPVCGYELLKENGTLGLYENKNALRTAVMADVSIVAASNEEYNTFAYQNALYTGMCEEVRRDVFVPVERSVKDMWNCRQNADGSFSLEDPENIGWTDYELAVQEEGYYYLQCITAEAAEVTATINGESIKLTDQENVVKRLGYLKPEDEVWIRCLMEGEGARHLDKVFVYREDAAALRAYAERLNAQPVKIEKQSEHAIVISCDNTEHVRKYLVLTIPRDKGWTVTVDMTEAAPEPVMGNCMAIPLEPGEHVIELHFVPPGLYAGLAVTGAAAVLLAGYFAAIQIKKKKGYFSWIRNAHLLRIP